jgi:hypothetical protein
LIKFLKDCNKIVVSKISFDHDHITLTRTPIKLLLGDTMTPEIWDQITDSKLVPEYLQSVEADFIEPRKLRQSLPHDTHLLEKGEGADPELDPDEYLDPLGNTTFEKIVWWPG